MGQFSLLPLTRYFLHVAKAKLLRPLGPPEGIDGFTDSISESRLPVTSERRSERSFSYIEWILRPNAGRASIYAEMKILSFKPAHVFMRKAFIAFITETI